VRADAALTLPWPLLTPHLLPRLPRPQLVNKEMTEHLKQAVEQIQLLEELFETKMARKDQRIAGLQVGDARPGSVPAVPAGPLAARVGGRSPPPLPHALGPPLGQAFEHPLRQRR
jgi:hypothetical protein